MQNNNQAIEKVLSNYIIENANLKIALEEQNILIKQLQDAISELEQVKEEGENDGVQQASMA